MKFIMTWFYRIVRYPILVLMSLYHFPRFKGRKNLPKGPAVICCNHSGLADPVWVVLAMWDKKIPWIMAKKEVMSLPGIGRFLSWFGAFEVDRDGADIQAIKNSMRHLRDGEKLLIFPEGTRVKKGMVSDPKPGAILLGVRSDVPIIPVFLTPRRKPFQPIKCIIGEPYVPSFEGKRPTAEELDRSGKELMQHIYEMGKAKK